MIGEGARDQEPDDNIDTRHKIYTGSDRRLGVIPYVMSLSVGCIAYDQICRLGDPAPSYYSGGAGL